MTVRDTDSTFLLRYSWSTVCICVSQRSRQGLIRTERMLALRSDSRVKSARHVRFCEASFKSLTMPWRTAEKLSAFTLFVCVA